MAECIEASYNWNSGMHMKMVRKGRKCRKLKKNNTYYVWVEHSESAKLRMHQ